MYYVQFRSLRLNGSYGKWSVVTNAQKRKEEAFNLYDHLVMSCGFSPKQYRVVKEYLVQKKKYRRV